MDDIFEVKLEKLVYGGDALGRLPDGRAVFVPFGLPGEKVRVKLTEQRRSHARGALLEVIEPAAERITPRCVHFGVCGGCHYQHLPYAAQLDAKREILIDQLTRIGQIENPAVEATVPSPAEYYYRNYVQFHLTAEGRLGYHLARSEQVFPVQECHLPEEPVNEVWPLLDFEAIPEIERIGLRLGSGEDLQLILESREPEPPEFSLEELDLSAVHLTPESTVVLAGSDSVIIEVLGRPFRVSAGSFFQVNTAMAEKMVTHLMESVQGKLPPDPTVLDVYCGAGLFSAFLAPLAKRLVGIELEPRAVEDFSANLDEFDNVEIYEAPAEAVLGGLDARPALVVVDPPRAGLQVEALDALVALAPPMLAYISCDPSTLARDLKRLLAAGFTLDRVTPFDLFPQTYHVETIVLMTKPGFEEK